MKVWKVTDHTSGEAAVYAEDTNILDIPVVSIELSYLSGGYEDERDEFISDIANARIQGRGSAYIEERLNVELVDIR